MMLRARRLAALEAVELAQRRWGGISILTHLSLATLAALTSDVTPAARLKGYIDAWYTASGERREPTDEWTYGRLVTALKDRSSEASEVRLVSEGASLNENQAAEVALAIARTLQADASAVP